MNEVAKSEKQKEEYRSPCTPYKSINDLLSFIGCNSCYRKSDVLYPIHIKMLRDSYEETIQKKNQVNSADSI